MTMASSAGATTFTTPADREVVMTRVFDAPRSLVFEAFTNPEHVQHWLLGRQGWTMPGRTTLSITILYPSKEARDAALGTGMKDGASASFDLLAEYLQTMGS